MCTRRSSRRSAFTLIELLVVIAIVGVLISITLPGMKGAREAARGSECASNIRQLVLAAHTYSDDFRGLLPPGASDFLRNLARWHGSRDHPSERFRSEGGALSEYLGVAPDGELAAPIRCCPSFMPVLNELAARGDGFERASGGYGYNNTFVGVRRRFVEGIWIVISDTSGSLLAACNNPAKTICFSDAAFASDQGVGGVIEYSFVEPRFWPDSPTSRADPSVHFRHGGGAGAASVAWLDGHVGSEKMTFSWSSGLYGVDAASVGIGFFGVEDSNRLYGEN